jgi:uncharacterized protein YqjF (DUF2071 family)
VSLVGFRFLNTKMLNMAIPFHRNFEEVNLRFYVRYKDEDIWKRGVVFIKEIVPKPAITLIANTLYNEHYVTRKMKHQWEEKDGSLITSYSWKERDEWQRFSVETSTTSEEIQKGSETEFITEHYWGYSKQSETKTTEYEVTHPKWEGYAVKRYNIDVDFGKVYGNDFQMLNTVNPKSVMLAEGSEITVESKKTIQ